MGFVTVFLYLITIITANIISSTFAPVAIGPFLISLGTFLIGTTFVLRDLVQNRYGRKKIYLVIGVAMILSAVSSHLLKESYAIVLASAAAFLVSETTDTEIYSRLKVPMAVRVFWSGFAGGILDSSVFVILGLSPLGAGFITWTAVPMAIIGQIIFKTLLQGVGAALIGYLDKKRDLYVGV
ncbi:hypothetical protein JCM14036_12340 [Desulfotomaculum defluvii]